MGREGVRGWTLCVPRYCIYAHACPLGGLRQRRVETYRCFRFVPPEDRPPPDLSPFALSLLQRVRREASGVEP